MFYRKVDNYKLIILEKKTSARIKNIFLNFNFIIGVAEVITQIKNLNFCPAFYNRIKNIIKVVKVISYSMNESEIDNRGTKSHSVKNSVKAQRVDGSWVFSVFPPKAQGQREKGDTLRYTLTGFERNSQLRILSYQLNKLFFSTSTSQDSCTIGEVSAKHPKLNPYFVTGFSDAESSFQIVINKNENSKIGWSVQPFFTIGLHSRDLVLLKLIKSYFGCGIIVSDEAKNVVSFRVSSLQDLTNIIIPHFSSYPLLTQKGADFFLFKKATELLKKKAHLTNEGLQELVNIKSSMNLGISNDLKLSFINTLPSQRPIIKTTNIQDFNWISGFISGEGNFFVDVFKSSSNKIGFQVKLRLSVTQHSRDKELLELIGKYLNAGVVNIHSENAYVFKITKLVDLTNKIIPLFEQNSIQGVKYLDYLDFCEVAKLMNEGKHLTAEGLDLIISIKNKMNTKRKI